MSVPEQITEFLIQNKPQSFCDDCIAERLGIKRRQQVQQTTKPLSGTLGFIRQTAQCSDCGQNKLVIHAN